LSDPPPFDPDRFREAAAYYRGGRIPYPPRLIRRVAEVVGLREDHRVLDLDSIANDADKAGDPDLTFLVRNAQTGYPSRIGRVTRRQPTDDQKRLARKKIQEIRDKYNSRTQNPFG
jgi:hypothetical protein